MTERQIRFDDGAAYEHLMGVWSRLVGEVFLDWLAPAKGQRWLDVGCSRHVPMCRAWTLCARSGSTPA